MLRTRLAGLLAACLLLPGAHAGTITTFAGGGVDPSPPPDLALDAPVGLPRAVVVDAAGDFQFAQGSSQGSIHKVSGGIISTRVPSAGLVTAMALDAAGNLYYTDSARHQVKKVDLANVVTVVAGTGTAGYGGDNGPAASALLNEPGGIAVIGNDILVSDFGNQRIRRISNGNITTVAGNGTQGSDGDGGLATAARIYGPTGIVGDGAGGFFFVHTPPPSNPPSATCCRIRHVDAAGTITTLTQYQLASPGAMARDAAGNLYLAGGIFASVILRISPSGTVTTVAGSGAPGLGGSQLGDGGPATQALLWQPFGVAIHASGEMYIADTSNNRIRKVNVAGIISTVAGGGSGTTPPPTYIGDGGPATQGAFLGPHGVSVDSAGNVLVSDTDGNRVRRIDTAGMIWTLAGTGASGFAGDGGSATSAWVSTPVSTLTAGSTVYISGGDAHIRRVDSTGIIATVAGTGHTGGRPQVSIDGTPAVLARFGSVQGLAMEAGGNLLFAGLQRVHRITQAGALETVAGIGTDIYGTPVYSGDGGLATRAGISANDLVIDGGGNLYVSEPLWSRIRKVDTGGVITTIAGDGTGGFSGDGGPAAAARLNHPIGLALDPSGNLYIADNQNYRIRRISPDGTISTIAGTGVPGFSGDGGDALAAQFAYPRGLAWHTQESALLVADSESKRIRKIAIADDTPAALQLMAQSGVALSAIVQSATVTPTAFDVAAPIAVIGGEYSIGCNGTFTSAVGTIAPGQAVCVRHTASASNNATTTTALTIGGVKGLFASTTLPGAGTFTALPAPIDLGTTWVYTPAATRQVTIANTGASAITLHSITTAAPFSLTHDCTAPLPAGASCNVQVGFKPFVAGPFAGAVTIQATAGTQTVALAGSGSASLSAHYYQSILARAPDAPGLAFWDSEAVRIAAAGANVNEAWFALAMEFYFSAEYVARNRDNAGYVTDLYLTFFNRAPDAPGQAYWVGQLAQGMPREVLLAAFMFSAEFTGFTNNIFGPRQVRAEVDMVMDLYRGLLARLPDNAGLATWVAKLRTAQCSVSPALSVRSEARAIADEFIRSAEYLARNRTNAQYVGDLYNAFFRRGGDLPGVQHWIGRLTSGAMTRAELLEQFAGSAEFVARVERATWEVCYLP